MDLKSLIRTVPDYPKPGIMFRDITTLLGDVEGFKHVINELSKRYDNKDIDVIAGIESRGFIVGAALAYHLGKRFVLVRKKGKLPAKTISKEYSLEYGTDVLEMHIDSIKKDENVVLVDDLLATGGTVLAAASLVQELGGKVHEMCFIIDLPDLNGSQKLKSMGYNVFNLIEFEGD